MATKAREETPVKSADKRWAARKAAQVTIPLDEESAARLRVMDALLAAFRVTAAGVDVTRWRPQLPPELKKRRGDT